VQSTLAAAIGVQSKENRERDFEEGNAGTFIVAFCRHDCRCGQRRNALSGQSRQPLDNAEYGNGQNNYGHYGVRRAVVHITF
jgi:hypothetical protein